MSKNTILCIDDEKFVLNSLKEQLKTIIGMDYNIEIAENGEEALEIFEELMREEVDVPLIISDYIMPGMKGDEVLKRIHSINPMSIKIMLTGQATIDGVKNAINSANLYRYISKPWEKEDLSLAIIEGLRSYDKDRKIELQNSILQEQNNELLEWTEAIVETMGTTLDTRDTTTSGHSKRLAEYAVKLAKAINRVDYGVFKDFVFSEEEIKELYYASLLHDIGKIGVREQVLLKQQRLTVDRQLAIKYRLSWYKIMLEEKKAKEGLDAEEETLLCHIPEYIEFILDMSKREFARVDEIDRIKEIAAFKFIDTDGNKKNLLDEFEMENLCIKVGNLTEAERDSIKSHAEHTYRILSMVPWPKGLSKIPVIAASHHEKLNGSGYYRGLKESDILVQSRILAILDIFEALTSPDRPYKIPKTIEEAIAILKHEVNAGDLDREIFEIFEKERVYE